MRQVFLSPDSQEPCSSGLADVPASAGHTIRPHDTRLSPSHQGWLSLLCGRVQRNPCFQACLLSSSRMYRQRTSLRTSFTVSVEGAPQQKSSPTCPASVCIPGDLCLGKRGQNLPMKRAFLSEFLSPSWLPFSRWPRVGGARGGGRDYLLTGPAAVLPGDIHPQHPVCTSPQLTPAPRGEKLLRLPQRRSHGSLWTQSIGSHVRPHSTVKNGGLRIIQSGSRTGSSLATLHYLDNCLTLYLPYVK